MTTRIRSKVGKCFRMNKAVIVGAERSLVARLPWAQEVPSSNLGAPTTTRNSEFFNSRLRMPVNRLSLLFPRVFPG